MNESLTATAPLNAGTQSGLYQRLVLDAMGRMTSGSLTLELPGGGKHTIGTQGSEISATIRVRDAAFFKRCVLFGDVGFGESYVDGQWDTDNIERVISWAILNIDNSPAMSGSKTRSFALGILKIANRVGHLLRPNSMKTARRSRFRDKRRPALPSFRWKRSCRNSP